MLDLIVRKANLPDGRTGLVMAGGRAAFGAVVKVAVTE